MNSEEVWHAQQSQCLSPQGRRAESAGIGLMARQMMAFRRFEFTAQIDWEVIPEPEMFVPAWKRQTSSNSVSYEVRPSAAPMTLRFLLRRIGSRKLSASFFSLSRQCLVPANGANSDH